MKFSLLIVFLPFLSFAGILGPMKTEGTVTDFDENRVFIKTKEGTRVEVPRSSIPASFRIRYGEKVISLRKFEKPSKPTAHR